MRHVSDAIAADLSKMHPDHRTEIRRVANADTDGTSIKGSARPMPFVTPAIMDRPPSPSLPTSIRRKILY